MLHSFTVTGMTCGHCEKAVTQALLELDPQAGVTIDRSAQRVHVQSNAAQDALAEAIRAEGYAVQPTPPLSP
jgi:copper chaperone